MTSALSTLSKVESSVVWVFSMLPLSREAIVREQTPASQAEVPNRHNRLPCTQEWFSEVPYPLFREFDRAVVQLVISSDNLYVRSAGLLRRSRVTSLTMLVTFSRMA